MTLINKGFYLKEKVPQRELRKPKVHKNETLRNLQQKQPRTIHINNKKS